MPKVRKIRRSPTSGINHYVVDANFLANRYIPMAVAPAGNQQDRIQACCAWWKEIEEQVEDKRARVYVPDICIAESFKVLAKKYSEDKWFKKHSDLNAARKKLRAAVSTPLKTLKAKDRQIKFHDVPTTRDIVIAVDRFYEVFFKHNAKVSLPDLILVATAKYMIDFFSVPKTQLHIVTLDKPLWAGTKKVQELPNAYDPTVASDKAEKVFE
jgi:predicted nucleic acid-binding protein